MTDIDRITRKANRTFILVCANFAMLAVLFLGLGFVVFQAATLVTGLKQDLARAEQQVAELKDRIQSVDSEAAMEKMIAAIELQPSSRPGLFDMVTIVESPRSRTTIRFVQAQLNPRIPERVFTAEPR